MVSVGPTSSNIVGHSMRDLLFDKQRLFISVSHLRKIISPKHNSPCDILDSFRFRFLGLFESSMLFNFVGSSSVNKELVFKRKESRKLPKMTFFSFKTS